MSGKGGVGKSTFAAALANALAEQADTCLVDADLAGPSIRRIMGVGPSVLAGGLLAPAAAGKLWVITPPVREAAGDHVPGMETIRYFSSLGIDLAEYVVIDTPPGTSDTHILLGKYLKQTSVVLVTTPHRLSVADTLRQIDLCRKAQMHILGVVDNMSGYVCASCCQSQPLFQGVDVEHVFSQQGISYLGRVPVDPEIARTSDSGIIPDTHPAIKSVIRRVAQSIRDSCIPRSQE